MIEVFGSQVPAEARLADLHFHTDQSFDVRAGMSPQEAAIFSEMSFLSAVAITDHDTIRPAYDALNYAVRNNFKVQMIVGEEVSTTNGHLIALFLSAPIQKGMPVEETIYQIHKQGGLAIAPHPFFRLTSSLQDKDILMVISNMSEDVFLDGFELASSGVMDVKARRSHTQDTNLIAQNYYRIKSEVLGAQIGGSDGHHLAIGRSCTSFEKDLEADIRNRRTLAILLERQEQLPLIEISLKMFSKERVESNPFLKYLIGNEQST